MLNVPIITTRLQAALAGLGLIAIAALVAGAGGFALGHRSAKSDGEASLAKLERQHADALTGASEHARARERELTIRANQLGAQLIAERSAHTEEAGQLKRRIDRVTNQYRPAPGAPLQPAPRCVFTNGFVGVWNGAIGAALVSTTDPAARAADPADPAEALDSGVRQADVLEHITDYGKQCRDIESQLNRVLDWTQEDRR